MAVNRLNVLDHPICLSDPALVSQSGWLGLVPFGMLLVDLIRPTTLVELGTHTGVSYCAFCQAVKELGLNTRCYAVDTWTGDSQAGYYGHEVLASLMAHHDPLYGGFSTLLRSTFEDALGMFHDGTIDLLHIDGLHTYEAVHRDFEGWLPKVSERGVVLLHDIAVVRDGYGVNRFWQEIKHMYPSFELSHSYGLGVLAVGQAVASSIAALTDADQSEQKKLALLFEDLGKQLELGQRLAQLQQTVRQQAEDVLWLQTEVADYSGIRNTLFVRLMRAKKRYGLRGAARAVGSRVLGRSRGE